MQLPTARSLPHALRQPPAVVFGCTAAACCHPISAWRVLVLAVYTATSYVTVLGALVVMNR